MNRNPFRLVAAGATLLLAACAATPSKPQAESLEVRAVKRWEHLIARQGGQAYDYLTPGYRATKTREAYQNEIAQRPVRWQKAELVDVECPETERCEVRIRIDFELAVPLRGGGQVSQSTVLRETWLRLDGNWFHIPGELAR